jgi:outer membrane usher protein
MATGLVRRGVTDALTVEAFGELGRNGGLAGGGGQIATDRLGVLSLAAAASRHADRDVGALIFVGVDRRMRRSSFQLQGRFATDQYRDGLSDYAEEFPDVSLRASAGIATSGGSFRTSYTAQRDKSLPDRSFLTLGWERSLAERSAVLAASAFHDFCRDETGFSVSLRMQIGKYSVRPAHDKLGGHDLLSLQVTRLKGPEDLLQWGMMLANSQAGETVQADVLADLATASVFLNGGYFSGTSAVSAGLRGGFTAFAGKVSAVRQASGAAVIVRTPGIAGLEIYQDNRLAAVTDANGEAVIGNIRPYEVNTLSIRPQDVPLEFTIGDFERSFVPRRGVSDVSFDLRRQSALAFTVRRMDGGHLAEGSRVYLSASGVSCPVGLEGRVYCAEADDGDFVIVQSADGSFTEGVASLRQTGEMWLAEPARLRLAEAL